MAKKAPVKAAKKSGETASSNVTKKKKKAPADLRTMILVRAWGDPKFTALVKKDPAAAVAELAEEYDIKIPEGVKFKTVVADPNEFHLFLANNPAGMLDTEMAKKPGPGGFPTVTADCFCGSTTTGGCSCGRTLYGTPCLGCSSLLCKPKP